MNTETKPITGTAEIELLKQAYKLDAKNNPYPSPFITESSRIQLRELPVKQEDMINAQRPVVAKALAANPPSGKFKAALLAARDLHRQGQEITKQIAACLHGRVSEEYERITESAGKAIVSGDSDALDGIESKEDVETRFAAERGALHRAMQKLGHAQTPHLVVIRDGIAEALAKYAKPYEDRDAADCADLGTPIQYSVMTRMIHAVQIQFARRTLDGIDKMVSLSAGHPSSPAHAFDFFEDFLDLSDW